MHLDAELLGEGIAGLVRTHVAQNVAPLAKRVAELEQREPLRGEKGDPGEPGAPSIDGQNGADGKDGERGADGKDGRDGSDGKEGTPGRDGVDGKDASPQAVADQIWIEIAEAFSAA